MVLRPDLKHATGCGLRLWAEAGVGREVGGGGGRAGEGGEVGGGDCLTGTSPTCQLYNPSKLFFL